MKKHIAISLAAMLIALYSTCAQSETVKVVDSNGRRVGTFYAPNLALRKINGAWILLPVDQSGFVGASFSPLFTTTDCTGTSYLVWLADAQPLVQEPSVTLGGLVILPDLSTLQNRMLESILSNGQCHPTSFSEPTVTYTTFDLSTLGLVPPFSVVRSVP